jgi:hypothetical protein
MGLNDGERIGIAVETWWDKKSRCVCLHLELVHSDASIFTDDWDNLDAPSPQDRFLN